ncbi:amino acid synthesis family protein [Sulfitobacter sp. SK012]|uniref:amino acid synthesis family protein n=1 Tax=Sulfitobacter sp. SK012 TaxID=1389005 RepID=UPI0013B42075|nr:amino acid synthesis family protein [Sulfitobacter sp. SK012]
MNVPDYGNSKGRFYHKNITKGEMRRLCTPITRAAGMAIFRNPCAGKDQDNLSQLFDVGAGLGRALTEELLHMLSAPPNCYAKQHSSDRWAEMKHDPAVLDPEICKPVREVIGGGKVTDILTNASV